MAHLVNPHHLFDPEADDPASPVWADGSWTGTLVWDSAVHVCEILLGQAAWRERLCGSSCVELGCGLGLPGLVARLLGAAPSLLTDRREVSELAEEACRINDLGDAHGVEFAWEENAARQLVAERLGGVPPDVVIACDCIFAPLFGDSHLLLKMLVALAGAGTTIILALERRPKDSAEGFFSSAAEVGFDAVLLLQQKRVVVCELWLRDGGKGPVGKQVV